MEALTLRIKRYPQLRGSTFQEPIIHQIQQALQYGLAPILEDRDLDRLWEY